MAKCFVTAFPFVRQEGIIEVPDDVSAEDVHDYISEHWDEIEFGEAELDYAGSDFDVN